MIENEKNEKLKKRRNEKMKREKWNKWKNPKKKKWKMKLGLNETWKNEKILVGRPLVNADGLGDEKSAWSSIWSNEKKNEKMDSPAKSSTISRVYRCCCNFFRQNPRRFPWFCFGMCLFPEENQQPVLRSHGFSEEKWQFSLDVRQKYTFVRRKNR